MSYRYHIDVNKIDAKAIAERCSERHIQSVIEDLVGIIKLQKAVVDEVRTLNPKCAEIGAGKLANILALVERVNNEVEWYGEDKQR